jgi:hypothetical protein
MDIAFGFRSHSGWAALVALDSSCGVVERRRIELVEPQNSSWAKQPYHAAESLEPQAARRLVARGIEAARRMACAQMRSAAARWLDAGHRILGCGIVGSEAVLPWTVEQILAVHMRMHKAEGVLFPAALQQAALACNLAASMTPEKELEKRAGQQDEFGEAARRLIAHGKSIGPPWGKDQKSAALAALNVLLG